MSRFASSLAFLVILALFPGPAAAEEGSETSYSHRMEQGRFFMKSGLAVQAVAEFEAAAQTPTGRMDPEVHHLLARAAWQAGRVGRAVEAVRHAWALVKGRGGDDLAELHEFLTKRFGKVLVIGLSIDGARRPEPAAPILDPEMKRAFEAALKALDTQSEDGSTSIWLPVGAYRIGSHLLEVTAGSTARMDLRPSVGEAARGVYGERTGQADGPRTGSAPSVTQHLLVRLGGDGFGQQGSGAGAVQVLAGWEPWLGPVALRLAGGLSAGRAERLLAEESAPIALGPLASLGVGVVGPLPDGGSVGPWLSWQVAWSGVADASLPEGYAGPTSYLVHGPELGLRLAPPVAGPVQPALSLYGLFREYQPLEAVSAIDQKPHFAAGGGAALDLLIGGAP